MTHVYTMYIHICTLYIVLSKIVVETWQLSSVELSGGDHETGRCQLQHLNHPEAQPETHRTTNLKQNCFKKHLLDHHLTFERKPLNVGFIISVVVTLTLEEKAMSISVCAAGNSLSNFVCMCVVLQGRGQADDWLPSTRSPKIDPSHQKHEFYMFRPMQ